uniref:CBS domain-containing protein n=1 Tax=Meloidogyne enterolobii TaxID=390850 RepID=A0A6V7UUB0_MELEN|nr:unnamed protein product [Meloidogyne enterolobii]
MFGNNSGKGKGSIRKAIYKQLARPNTSANENTSISTTDRSCQQEPKPRPPSFTFSSPSGANVAAANNLSMVGTLAVSSPAAIASDENASGMNIPFSDKAIPPSSSAPEATAERQNLFLHPKQLNNGHQITRVPCHQQHYRSISDSPKYVNTTGKAFLATNSPAPLLIPLGNKMERTAGAPLSARPTLQHRSSLNNSFYSMRPKSATGPNIFLATRLDHPTVFDFEDWHTSLDKQSQEAVYSLFMKAHKCYDIVPTSSKLVVFDTQLPVSKAFFALVYNGVRAAPLWDSSTQEFVGMLTITDFIQILHRYYKNDQMEDGVKLEEHKISTWRDIFKADCSLRPFITVDPTESLYRAVQLLCEHKIHRLPVMEHSTGNILYILTHKRLIKFLHLYISDLPKPAFMDKTPKELGIGSWENILTIDKSTPLIEAMKTFLSKRVSALPLIDSDGKVVDIYAKFDVINLAADKTYDKLDVTVYEALKQRSEWFEGVRRCSDKDSLNRVIDILVKAEVHRLVAVDDENRAVGIISLSDVLRHLILELPGSKDIERQIANAMGAREPSDTGIVDLESSIEDVHVAQRV